MSTKEMGDSMGKLSHPVATPFGRGPFQCRRPTRQL